MQQRFIGTAVALFGIAASLSAHVSLQPRESAPGATITYTVRVPTEGTVATTGIELEIPEAVSMISVEGAADTYEVKKSGDRIVSIAWKTDIQPAARTKVVSTVEKAPMPADHKH